MHKRRPMEYCIQWAQIWRKAVGRLLVQQGSRSGDVILDLASRVGQLFFDRGCRTMHFKN